MLESGTLRGVGGFSLLCGTLRPDPKRKGKLQPLAVISNRTEERDAGVESHALWIGGSPKEEAGMKGKDKVVDGETHGLSNSLFDDPWPKVEIGRQLLDEVVFRSVEDGVDEAELVERLMEVLSHDTLPKIGKGDSYETEIGALVHSVFIPPFDAAVERSTETKAGEQEKDEINEPTAGMKSQPPDHINVAQPAPTTPAPVPGPSSPCCGVSTPPPGARTPSSSSAQHTKKTIPLVNVALANASFSSNPRVEADHICATPTLLTHPHHRVPNVELEEEVKKSPRVYGTQTQTVILVDKGGRLKYVERRLWDEDAKPVEEEMGRDRVVEFKIEGWEEV